MKEKYLSKHIIWLSFLLLAIGTICFNHVLELRNEEGRRAIVSMEMIHMDEYIVPHLQGVPYYNKPPLYNWVLAATFWIFGSSSEFFLRLPGALSFLATALIVFLFGRRYVGRETALLMSAAFLTVADLLFYGSVNAGEIDLFYSLLVVLQAFVIFHYREKENYFALFLLSYLLTAIGALTKGLPSLAFQALTLLVYLSVTRRFPKLLSWQHLLGISLFLALVGSYFYVYSTRNEVTGYLVNLFKQASQRTANEYNLLESVLAFFYFPVYLFRYLLPWSLLSVFFLFRSVRGAILKNQFTKFGLVFILANILLYWTAPELRVRYIYMFFPFFVILLVYAAHEGFQLRPVWGATLVKIFFTVVAVTGAACFVLLFLPFEITAGQIAAIAFTGTLLIGLSVLMWRNSTNFSGIWGLVLALAVVRMGYNIVGLPYTQKNLDFRSITSEMLNLCNNCRINLTGSSMALVPDVAVFGKEFFRDTLIIPQEIPYQVPYYYTLWTGDILTYQPETKTGEHYIAYKSKHITRDTVLAEYPKVFGDGTLIFFQEQN